MRDLNPLIERIRAERGVPAMAVALILSNRIAGIGASGDRRFGTNAPVTLQDRWHLGSLTKSMTADAGGHAGRGGDD